MKRKYIVLLLLFTSVVGQAVTKQDPLKRAKVLETQFGRIRAEIARSACAAFDYKNEKVLGEINSKQLISFHDSLKKDSLCNKALVFCLGEVPAIPTNGDIDNCIKQVNNYLNQVKEGCYTNGKDTTWVPDIRKWIQNLVNQCICFDKGDTALYHSTYPQGLFSGAYIVDNQELEEVTVQQTEANATKEIDNKAQGAEIRKNDDHKTGLTDRETKGATNRQKNAKAEVKTDSKTKEGTIQQNNANNTIGSEVGTKEATLQQKDTIISKETEVITNNVESIDNGNKWLVPLIVAVLASLTLCCFYFVRKRKMRTRPVYIGVETTSQTGTGGAAVPAVPEPCSISGQEDPGEEKSPSAVLYDLKPNWIILGASVKGNGHAQSNMPCQDSNKFESIGDGWGIAIVSDGAGSAAHSEVGSKVVVERGMIHFKSLIEKEGWKNNGVLPTDAEWLQMSYNTLKIIRDEVGMVAKKNEVEFKSLSATCLVVIYSPLGLLATHIGDGRMGYKTKAGGWKSMMTPHKGAEANQTIFLISDFWSCPNYVMSGVLVPESVVIREPIQAFALMSDGCENTSWKCTILDPETGKYYDRNEPFEGFFNPIEETILSFEEDDVPEDERQKKWRKFIESGTTGFVREQDDKTLIYGVNLNLCK